MVLCDISLGDGKIAFDHFEPSVPQDVLQRVDVASVPKEVYSEGVAESVKGGSFDSRSVADCNNPLAEHSALESIPSFGDK